MSEIIINTPRREDVNGITSAILKQNSLLEQYFRVTQSAFSTVATWKEFKEICESGAAKKFFSIGDQYQCNKGGTTITWDLVHIGDNDDGSNYAVLYAHDLIGPNMQHCRRQALFYATSEVPAGTYHFTPVTTNITGTEWGAGGEWGKTMQITTTKAIPKGGQITFKDDLGWNESSYHFYKPWSTGAALITVSGPTSDTPIEELTPTKGSSGTDLTTLGEVNWSQRAAAGYDRWRDSDVRMYLNSKAEAGKWWSATSGFSRINGSASIAGFMNDIDSDFLDVLSKVKLKTDTNKITDSGIQDITYDTFFLPCRANLNYGNNDENNPESTVDFDYYTKFRQDGKTGTNTGSDDNRLKSNGEWYHLRSPNVRDAHVVFLVHNHGILVGDYASVGYRLAPACCINYHN